MKGYGMYWVLIEALREQDGFKLSLDDITISSLSEDFKSTFDEAKQFIDDCVQRFKLLKTDEQHIWSDSLNSRMQKMLETRAKRSIAGKKGMKNRWSNKADNDNKVITKLYEFVNNDIKQDNTDITQDNKGEYSKVKNKKDIYITAQDLSMTKIEYEKLVELYGKDKVDDKIEYARNYKKLKDYVSLYLTLNNWLKKDAKKEKTEFDYMRVVK